MKQMKLIDTLSSTQIDTLFGGETVGLFTNLIQDSDPWYDKAYSMCAEWYLQRSGNKNISAMWAMMIEQNRDYETLLPNILRSKYLTNWTKIWEALNSEYTLLDSTSGKKEYTDTKEYNLSEIINNETKSTGTATGTNTTSTDDYSSDTDSFYGFNSTVSSPRTLGSVTTQNDETTTDTSNTSNTVTGDESKGKTGTETLTHTEQMYYRDKSGTVLIKEEVDFRLANNFTDIILTDLDNMLLISVYD